MLFCPGPIKIEKNVRESLTTELISHRTKEFQVLFKECQELTLQLFNTTSEKYTPLFITGSGTTSIECMIYSYLSKKRVLCLSNGYFGEKWELFLKNYSKDYDFMNFGWNNEFDYNKIENYLSQDYYDVVFFVHHETSTTMINDIERISKICKFYNTTLTVDCVSSVGFYDIDLTSYDNIDMLVYSSNKCLGSYPGLSVTIVKNNIVLDMDDKWSCLNLKIYYKYALQYETPFTPCIQNFFSYKQALINCLKINKSELHAKYRKQMSHFLNKLKGFHMHPVLKTSQCDWVCNVYCTDPSYIYNKLHENGYIIYRCKEQLYNTSIQLSILKQTPYKIEKFLNVLKDILDKNYFIDGCFDGYHYGHVNAIFQSKQLCDNLILGTHDDVEMNMHKNRPVFNYEERLFMLKNCKYIDHVSPFPVPYITKVDILHKHQCSKYLHGEEAVITKNNENGIQIPSESYATYKTTNGISTSKLLARLYHYSTGVPIQQNEDCEYLRDISDRMVAYNELNYNKTYNNDTVYIYHDWDLLCSEHIKVIQSIKNKYSDNKIIAVIKPGVKTIYNQLERLVILQSIKDIDAVTLLGESENEEKSIHIDLNDKTCEYYFFFDKKAYILNIMDNYETCYKQKIGHLIQETTGAI